MKVFQGLGGMKTYASTPGQSKKALLYTYDIAGYCAQNYQGASNDTKLQESAYSFHNRR